MNEQYFRIAEQDLNAGEAEMETSNKITAIKFFREGISTLGNHYLNAQTIDDTGMKIVLANNEERNGNVDRCASLLRSVLASRLEMFRNKTRGQNKRYPTTENLL